jgi:uncharacterized protein (TIGR03437 family)
VRSKVDLGNAIGKSDLKRFAHIPVVLFLGLVIRAPGWSMDLPRYALILSDPAPIEARARGGERAVVSARAQVKATQRQLMDQLHARGIRVTGAANTLLNAVFVAASPQEAAQFGSIPGVIQVAHLNRFHLNLDHATQLISVPAAYNLIGGASNAGAGVRIGIIDTGITASHPAFQDSSLTLPAGFPVCQINFGVYPSEQFEDCSASDAAHGLPVCSAVNCAFTNNKIIVARSYVPVLNSGVPSSSTPDDYSPRDRVGHGTATAMAAAGETSTGPEDTITGVAPKAFLGSYKVFGSPGVNDFTSGDAVIEALEDAFRDGMDIVSISLGGPAFTGPVDRCGTPRRACDPEASAVQQAVAQGMVVVAAAGNAAQTGMLATAALNTINSPADAPNAIAVGATTNSHNWGNHVTINGVGSFFGQLGDGPAPSATLNGPLGDVANVGDPQACTSPPAGSLTGKIVLVERGGCVFQTKVEALQAAGAIAAIITNKLGDDTLVSPGGLNATTIPAIFIGYDDGQEIRSYLGSNSHATAGIDPSLVAVNVTTANQVAPFSSHGPVLGSAALKPEVAAVGVDLYLAGQSYDPNGLLYTPSGYLVSQGTSFSTPQVAGIAALVKQQNPNLSALQIRSAIINTATQTLTENGGPASVLAMGAGLANAAGALANTLAVIPATASFGVIGAATLPASISFQLTNTGSTPLNLSVAINRRTAENSAKTSINLPNLTLAPGESSTALALTLSGTVPSPGIYEGFVTINGAPSPINIPYLYVVGDGVPANLISITSFNAEGIVGKQNGFVIVEAIDQYGVPVTGQPVTFNVASGGGTLIPLCITTCDAPNDTDNYGQAAAAITLGPNPGSNAYSATLGSLSSSFTAAGIAMPAILPKGAVNAANYANQPLAPGSYVALFGNNLAPSTALYNTTYLPVSLNSVSVSFDAGGISAPGHLGFVSEGQIDVQIPWELQGQTSAQVKISVSGNPGAVYTMQLGPYSPALFVNSSGGQSIAAAVDPNGKIITLSNPAKRGQIVTLYGNGMGPVTNQPLSGDPAPFGPLAQTTTTPVITIGGVTVPSSNVLFSGMTPGDVALYQINVLVPADVPLSAALQPLTVSIGGVVSPAVILPVQ